MARKAYEEAIRLYLETSGQEGLDAMRKSLGALGDTSSASAAKAEQLVAELDQLATTSNHIRNFTALKAAISETGTSLGKAKDNLDKLKTEFQLVDKPTKAMETAMAKAERQVTSLTKAQNKQAADLARTTGALSKAGIDTNHLASAYEDLQAKFGNFAGDARDMANAMAQTGKNSNAAAAGVAGLGSAAKAGAASVAAIASRLTLVSGAAVAAVSALASFSGYSFFKGAVDSATTLEDALGQVRAVSGATAEEMVLLKEAAESGGAATRFSSLEAAQGLGELARATGSARGAIAALPAALNLAQAAGIGVAEAAQFITTTLTQFGLGAEEASRVADVLAHAANSTTADVRGLGDALTYAAPLAAQLGIDTEKTVAIIGALADQGFRGERAGTALRNVFSEMLDPASAFGKALRDLGVESSDFATVVAGLAKAGDRGKQAIMELDAAARPAILALVNSGGAALQQLDKDLRAAGGAAEATAKVMAQNVAGANEAIRETFDRTRRSLVEPLLEPLRAELFSLSAELEAFAQSPEFAEIKGALTELFIESAAAAKELIREIDFHALAQQIRDFVGDAGSAMTEFRENLDLVVAAITHMGRQFTLAFNAVQTVVLGLGAGITKLLELVMRLQLGISYIPRRLLDLAGASDETGQRMQHMADVLGKVSDDLSDRTGRNLTETVDAVKAFGESSTDAAGAAATGFTAATTASDELTVAAPQQPQAAQEAAAALTAQADAATAAGGASEVSANQMDLSADRIKKAFSDLGITSQTNLERAAESAKRNFELIQQAVGQGEASAEDARRAFAAYAQAARAAVADSDASARDRVENELKVREAIINATRSLDSMGDAGEIAGRRVAGGANQAAGALNNVGTAASSAGGSTKEVADATDEANDSFMKATEGSFALAAGLGNISKAATDMYLSVSKAGLNRALGMTTGTQLGGDHPLNRVTDMIKAQVEAFDLNMKAIEKQLGAYDELKGRREELSQQYDFLGQDRIEQMLQAEQRVKAAQKQRNQEQERANEEQRQADIARLGAQQELKQAAGPDSQVIALSDNTVTVKFDLPAKALVTAANAAEAEFVDRMARLLLPKLIQLLARARSTTGGGNNRTGR